MCGDSPRNKTHDPGFAEAPAPVQSKSATDSCGSSPDIAHARTRRTGNVLPGQRRSGLRERFADTAGQLRSMLRGPGHEHRPWASPRTKGAAANVRPLFEIRIPRSVKATTTFEPPLPHRRSRHLSIAALPDSCSFLACLVRPMASGLRFHDPWLRLKNCTARSCFFAAASVRKVPRFLRLPVLGLRLRE